MEVVKKGPGSIMESWETLSFGFFSLGFSTEKMPQDLGCLLGR